MASWAEVVWAEAEAGRDVADDSSEKDGAEADLTNLPLDYPFAAHHPTESPHL